MNTYHIFFGPRVLGLVSWIVVPSEIAEQYEKEFHYPCIRRGLHNDGVNAFLDAHPSDCHELWPQSDQDNFAHLLN